MTVVQMHPLRLAEAEEVLARVGFRDDWTGAELRAAMATWGARDFELVPIALNVTAAAMLAEVARQREGTGST